MIHSLPSQPPSPITVREIRSNRPLGTRGRRKRRASFERISHSLSKSIIEHIYDSRAFFLCLGRPIGKADTGRLQLRYCPQAANTLRYRPIGCANTGSRALYVAIAPYELGGAAQTAVAVVKNCCECDEWPLQSSSMDDCMTNAKKSSKEPPVVRLPSCTYSHALHIQAQAPSSL